MHIFINNLHVPFVKDFCLYTSCRKATLGIGCHIASSSVNQTTMDVIAKLKIVKLVLKA